MQTATIARFVQALKVVSFTRWSMFAVDFPRIFLLTRRSFISPDVYRIPASSLLESVNNEIFKNPATPVNLEIESKEEELVSVGFSFISLSPFILFLIPPPLSLFVLVSSYCYDQGTPFFSV